MFGYTIFHNELMLTLLKSVRENKNANTYIFEGAKGLGKHNAARVFAAALVCDNIKEAPCGECAMCREAKALSHPDIIYVKPEKDKATLGIEPVRNMINECMIKPFYKRHKVFIIDDGDIITPQAQNAFLKLMEEPPDYAVFIIVCESAQTLLQTVRSRSVTITFAPVSEDVVKEYIEKTYPDEARIDFLVKYCGGIPKYADDIINNDCFEKMREEVLNLVPRLLSKNKVHAYDVSAYIDEHKDDAERIYDLMLMYLRDALVMAMGRGDNIINTDKTDKITLLAQKYTPRLLALAIDEVMLSKKMLGRHVKASATALHAALKIK